MNHNPFEPTDTLGPARFDESYIEPVVPTEPKDVLSEPQARREFPIMGIIFVLGILVLLGRLLILQVVQNTQNRVLAEGNRIRAKEISAPRGAILDRNGAALVENVSSFGLEIFPSELPRDQNERRTELEELNHYFALPTDVLTSLEQERLKTLVPISLSTDVPRDQALLLETKINDWPGVSLGKNPRRQYQSIPGFGAILGYTGKITSDELKEFGDQYRLSSIVGKTGLEKEYERFLHGTPGEEQAEVDSRGVVQRQLASIDPKPGNTLLLNIDRGVQKAAADALSEQITADHAPGGAVVALDPRSGAVRAMVSLPSFDPNSFSGGLTSEAFQKLLNDPGKPLLNRATSGEYESGSTIKPFVFTGGLEAGVITPQLQLDTPPAITVGQWTFPDWKDHGMTDVKRAIAESNNIFAYIAGGGWNQYKGLGVQRLSDWLKKFNFGSFTQVDLPTERKGNVPTPDWKLKTRHEKWYIGDTYNLSIGQGDFLTTPLQLAAATASIANGGTYWAPRLADKIEDSQGNVVQTIEPKIVKDHIASPTNLGIIRDGMRMTVTEGSGRAIADLPFPVSAKTGTAQFGADQKTHAWFTSYGPSDNPQLVVTVIIEAGGQGHAAALPVAKKVLQAWWDEGHK